MKTSYQILVADDDPAARSMVVRALTQHYYECDTASDAVEAAEMLGAKNYDLLVSDLDMPGNNDLQFIRDLPQIAAGLPVILLTGHPTVETAMESLQLPVTAYLAKPFKLEEFLRLADSAVRNYQAYCALRASEERTDKWHQELAAIGTRLRKVRAPDAAPWEALLDLTRQNITASLQDFQTFAIFATQQKSQVEAPVLASGGGPLLLVNALRETISVLEKTRGSFKSKELGDLRKKLESLVSGSRDGRQI